jgi:hypothetical protein
VPFDLSFTLSDLGEGSNAAGGEVLPRRGAPGVTLCVANLAPYAVQWGTNRSNLPAGCASKAPHSAPWPSFVIARCRIGRHIDGSGESAMTPTSDMAATKAPKLSMSGPGVWRNQSI